MPLVENVSLPAFQRLRQEGQTVLTQEQALRQDIRELHIGLLNMMPDGALEATERQFLRLIGSCNPIAQFYVHPFTLPGLPRGQQAQGYLEQHYEDFAQIQSEGLDALIITGANVTQPRLEVEPFWRPLLEVVEWAESQVTSIFCSCLASHALLQHKYALERRPLARKRWGVYPHRARRPSKHPLLRDINTRFDVPHSRWNEVTREQLLQVGVVPLIESFEGDVHLAVSPDGCRMIYSQGHPEYDLNSLLKEYRRDLLLFFEGRLSDCPPFPDHYFPATVQERLLRDCLARRAPERFPVSEIEAQLDNTWGDTGRAVFNNWLGMVYQLTHLDRRRPFVDGIDPQDPLGWRGA